MCYACNFSSCCQALRYSSGLNVWHIWVLFIIFFSHLYLPHSSIHIVSYESPLTGKRYNADYRANWNFQPPVMQTFQPIQFTIPHPASLLSMFKPLNFNANWNFNHGSGLSNSYQAPVNSYVPPPIRTTQSPPPPQQQHQQTHSFKKQFNWDLNYNYNHGSSSTLGAAATSEKEEAPVEITTTTTTEKPKPANIKPVSNNQNSNGYHGVKKVNVELSLNINHGSSESPGNVTPSTKLQPPNKSNSDDNDDLDANIDDEIDDANNESSSR